MTPARRATSLAMSTIRPRPSSIRRANAAASVGSGSARKARSRATSTICARSSSAVPSGRYAHRRLLQVGQVLLERLERVAHLQRDQPAQAGAVLRSGDLGLVEDLDLDVRALVDQRRIADQREAALGELHQLGQLAEGPCGVRGARRVGRRSGNVGRRVRRGRTHRRRAASGARRTGAVAAALAWDAHAGSDRRRLATTASASAAPRAPGTQSAPARRAPPSARRGGAIRRAGDRARRRRAGSSPGAAQAARA